MTEATISHLKNHLPEVVHTVEKGEDIHITRHGKPVAVMISLEKYRHVLESGKSIFSSYLTWRDNHPNHNGFTDKEIEKLRDQSPHDSKESIWD